MNKPVIKVENLSKAYQLGEFSTGTLSRDIERWWARTRGKEDPFLKIGEKNDRTIKGQSDVAWSLKDLNFEVHQGDAVGIIGRNGAGKSTLLKVLSRVTAPTTGSIKLKGRVASLLEVGTGFHPELTGRENIFLNGAILGMRKTEIRKHFDAIVDFAGVQRYIDTPVKRYSSGMYVRLAFAVAAHLESEILIVDEVLAVGDAEFQKKCIGKMNDVSKGEGRTVLFVSHNMSSIKNLCSSGLFLKNGTVAASGIIDNVINFYNLETHQSPNSNIKSTKYFKHATITNAAGVNCTTFKSGEDIKLEFSANGIKFNNKIGIGIYIKNNNDERISGITSYSCDLNNGSSQIAFQFKNTFVPGTYRIEVVLAEKGIGILEHFNPLVSIEIVDHGVFKTGEPVSSSLGYNFLNGTWQN